MKRALCLVLIGLLASAASADLIVNGSFEDPVLADGSVASISSGAVTGWKHLSGDTPYSVNASGYFPKTGDNYVYHIGFGTMVQVVGELQANTTYTLSLDMGSGSTWYGLASEAYVSLSKVTSSGGWLAGLAHMGATSDSSDVHYIADPGAGNATRVVVQYTTGATVNPGEYLGVILGTAGRPTAGYGVCWDDVTLTAVPEPATMGLLALGSVAGLIRRRR